MLLLVDLPLMGNDGGAATSAAVNAADFAAGPSIRFVETAKIQTMSKQGGQTSQLTAGYYKRVPGTQK